MYDIQHCFICRPSDSTVSEDAGIEPRLVATTALAVRRSNTTWLDLIHKCYSVATFVASLLTLYSLSYICTITIPPPTFPSSFQKLTHIQSHMKNNLGFSGSLSPMGRHSLCLYPSHASGITQMCPKVKAGGGGRFIFTVPLYECM
jgi:hypothetical protein